MNLVKYKKNVCQANIKIRQALLLLNVIQIKCLIVLDNNKKLVGTLTEGDLRRSLISGAKFNDRIIKCINKRPISIYKKKLNNYKNLEIPKDVSLVPLIDVKKKISWYF